MFKIKNLERAINEQIDKRQRSLCFPYLLGSRISLVPMAYCGIDCLQHQNWLERNDSSMEGTWNHKKILSLKKRKKLGRRPIRDPQTENLVLLETVKLSYLFRSLQGTYSSSIFFSYHLSVGCYFTRNNRHSLVTFVPDT